MLKFVTPFIKFTGIINKPALREECSVRGVFRHTARRSRDHTRKIIGGLQGCVIGRREKDPSSAGILPDLLEELLHIANRRRMGFRR